MRAIMVDYESRYKNYDDLPWTIERAEHETLAIIVSSCESAELDEGSVVLDFHIPMAEATDMHKAIVQAIIDKHNTEIGWNALTERWEKDSL